MPLALHEESRLRQDEALTDGQPICSRLIAKILTDDRFQVSEVIETVTYGDRSITTTIKMGRKS